MSRAEQVDMADFENRKLALVTQADLLSLNRTTLYYKPKPPSDTEIAIKHAIDRIYTEDLYIGSRPITAMVLALVGRQ